MEQKSASGTGIPSGQSQSGQWAADPAAPATGGRALPQLAHGMSPTSITRMRPK
jgi:hypothetical protein